jgi:hypothetical protein
MSWRRLGVILDQLPPESAYYTAVRESLSPHELAELSERADQSRFGPWSHLEMLLARVGDGINHLAWMQTKGDTPAPDPYPRPGVRRPGNVVPLNPEAAAYHLAYLREVERLHGAAPAPDWRPAN